MFVQDTVTVPVTELARVQAIAERRAAESVFDMHAAELSNALTAFLDTHPGGTGIEERDLKATYTRSAAYLKAIAGFQHHQTKVRALNIVYNYFQPNTRALDLGCCAGFTGLALRLSGWPNVDFADFEGLGLEFVRQFCLGKGWQAEVHPYDLADGALGGVPCYELVLAFDVIEHTPNQLAFIEWLRRLGKYVAITWPTVGWVPPLYQPIDAWVDQEATMWVIERRYRVLEAWFEDNRQFMLFETGA